MNFLIWHTMFIALAMRKSNSAILLHLAPALMSCFKPRNQ